MIADLHIHTYFSDGTRSPEEVVEEAKQNGIGLISVCDHNSIASFPRLKKACDSRNITCISGAEIDCLFGGLNIHILAYNCRADNPSFINLLKTTNDIMEQMSVDLVEKMSVDYPQIGLKEYEVFNRTPVNGGWKGIDYLKSKGFTVSYPECMKYYREYGAKCSSSFQTMETVCGVIHNAGGLAVLAHPGERLDKTTSNFMKSLYGINNLGIDGIECYYPSHNKEITDICVNFCRGNDLLITAGSDSHGDFASFIDGIHYAIGAVKVDINDLNLKGLI
ncbi:MAG TPA: PHP domain-containing protein [Clostridia bacterium]|nr:PHP domain-containing protein [Clostridia bacterium]